MAAEEFPPTALARLAAEIRDSAWELALAVVEEGLEDDQIPSLARLGQEGQLGDMPTFIVELSRELADPQPARLRRGGPLAALVRDHARVREELGFAPREIVTEFLLLRRVLWRLVSARTPSLETGDVLLAEQRLNDTIDRLITECVVAYFDRATLELANQARRDPLTQLLNHQAFTEDLELELERAKRYARGVTLVYLDIDGFKQINDMRGHQEGDRVLRELAQLLRSGLRASDLAGRMGGDEFAIALVESEAAAGERLLDRLHHASEVSISGGCAHYPTDAQAADALFRVADTRLYEAKRAR